MMRKRGDANGTKSGKERRKLMAEAPVPMTIRTIKPPEKPPDYSKKVTTSVENLTHKKAFEYYYNLGDERNHIKVGKHFKVVPGTIASWSRKYGWVARVQARDKEIGDRLKYESEADTTETRKNILTIIRTLVKNSLEIDEEGNVKIKGLGLKNIGEMREAYELAERILNPDAVQDGIKGANQVLVNIQK